MTRYVLALLAALSLAPAFSAAGAGDSAGSDPLRVLILTGKHNHEWEKTTPALKEIYEKSGRFAVDVTTDPSTCNAGTFARYDVVVSNWCAWPDVNGRQ